MTALLPRARLADVLRGAAPLVGTRCDAAGPRGFVSPVEARARLGLAYGDLAGEERARLGRRGGLRDAAVVLQAALVGLLPAPPTRDRGRTFVVSAPVDPMTIDEAVEAITAPHALPRSRLVWFVHPHALTLAAFDGEHRARLACGDVLLPDGVGLRLGAALLGASFPHNVNGTDLLPLLCAALAQTGRPLVLVGSAPGVADDAAERLRRAFPGLRIPIVSSGFLDEESTRALVARIEGEVAPVVLVGMGSPRQEAFALRWLAKIPGATVVTVGGLLDFYAERVARAPAAWRELGLEWAFRLRQEPARLATRYLIGNPVFLGLVALQRMGLRRSRTVVR